MTVDWDWSRVVFDHVKIGVRDAEASRTFYRTVLATLASRRSGKASTAASTPISSSVRRPSRAGRS